MADDEQIKSWRASISPSENLAAEIASWARGQEAWTMVPYGTQIPGIRPDFDPAEFDLALALLAERGILTRDRGEYFVAPGS